MSKQITNKRGAPKGNIGNPNSNNQWDGVRSDRPISTL